MHGVPSDLPLLDFIGRECNQIALGQFQIQFHFSGAGSIIVESRWELRDPTGTLLDGACAHTKRESYHVHKIIDVKVVRYAIDSPRSFTLYFQTGHALTVFDDSEKYEAFSVQLKTGANIVI